MSIPYSASFKKIHIFLVTGLVIGFMSLAFATGSFACNGGGGGGGGGGDRDISSGSGATKKNFGKRKRIKKKKRVRRVVTKKRRVTKKKRRRVKKRPVWTPPVSTTVPVSGGGRSDDGSGLFENPRPPGDLGARPPGTTPQPPVIQATPPSAPFAGASGTASVNGTGTSAGATGAPSGAPSGAPQAAWVSDETLSGLNQEGGLVTDALANGVKSGGTPGFGASGLVVEGLGTAISTYNIGHATGVTALSANAEEYSENFDNQMRTSVTAIATAGVGGAIATTAFAGLATVAGVVTAPVLAVSVAAAATVAIVGTYVAGVTTTAVYDRFFSAGVKARARNRYNSLVGGFSRLTTSLGF